MPRQRPKNKLIEDIILLAKYHYGIYQNAESYSARYLELCQYHVEIKKPDIFKTPKYLAGIALEALQYLSGKESITFHELSKLVKDYFHGYEEWSEESAIVKMLALLTVQKCGHLPEIDPNLIPLMNKHLSVNAHLEASERAEPRTYQIHFFKPDEPDAEVLYAGSRDGVMYATSDATEAWDTSWHTPVDEDEMNRFCRERLPTGYCWKIHLPK